MRNMINLKKHDFPLAGVGLGMTVGFMHWKYAGYVSGAPLRSTPPMKVMGGLILTVLEKDDKKYKSL